MWVDNLNDKYGVGYLRGMKLLERVTYVMHAFMHARLFAYVLVYVALQREVADCANIA